MNVFGVYPESRIRVHVGGIKIHARAKRRELGRRSTTAFLNLKHDVINSEAQIFRSDKMGSKGRVRLESVEQVFETKTATNFCREEGLGMYCPNVYLGIGKRTCLTTLGKQEKEEDY